MLSIQTYLKIHRVPDKFIEVTLLFIRALAALALLTFIFSLRPMVSGATEVIPNVKVEKITLTLEETLNHSILNNFDQKMSAIAVQEKEGTWTKAKGEFEPNLSLGYTLRRNISPTSSSLDGTATDSAVRTRDTITSLGIKNKFFTGTELDIPYQFTQGETNSTLSRFGTSQKPSLTFRVSQPITKLFSPGYFTTSLARSQWDWKSAQFEEQEKLTATLTKSAQLFWDVIKEKERLKIRKASAELSRSNLQFVIEKKKLGKSSAIELLEAQSNALRQEELLLQAQDALVKIQEEFSLHVLNSLNTNFELKSDLDKIDLSHSKVLSEADQKTLEEMALGKKPDLFSQRLSIEKAQRELRNANIDRYPQLKIQADQSFSALSSKFGTAHGDLFDRKYPSWSVTSTLEHPILMRAASGAYLSKVLKLKQEQLKLRQEELDCTRDIRKNVRDIQTQAERILALSQALEAESQKLEAKTQEFRLGRITDYELNQAIQSQDEIEIQTLEAKVSFKLSEFKLKLKTEMNYKSGGPM